MGEVAQALLEALQGPAAVMHLVRPLPDILAAFTRRVAALGATPSAPPPRTIDFLQLLDDARPRSHKARLRFD